MEAMAEAGSRASVRWLLRHGQLDLTAREVVGVREKRRQILVRRAS